MLRHAVQGCVRRGRVALTPPASSASALTLATRNYDKRVIDHFERPRNVGSLDRKDASVGTGTVGAPGCGDVMQLQMKIDGTGRVEEIVQKTFGCGSAISSASYVTEWAKGRHVSDVVKMKNQKIAKYLSLPPVKLHCSMLAEDALKSAASDWMKKNQVADLDTFGDKSAAVPVTPEADEDHLEQQQQKQQ